MNPFQYLGPRIIGAVSVALSSLIWTAAVDVVPRDAGSVAPVTVVPAVARDNEDEQSLAEAVLFLLLATMALASSAPSINEFAR